MVTDHQKHSNSKRIETDPGKYLAMLIDDTEPTPTERSSVLERAADDLCFLCHFEGVVK